MFVKKTASLFLGTHEAQSLHFHDTDRNKKHPEGNIVLVSLSRRVEQFGTIGQEISAEPK
jgi:hypothetical protein